MIASKMLSSLSPLLPSRSLPLSSTSAPSRMSSSMEAIITAIAAPTPYPNQNLRNNALFDMTRPHHAFAVPISSEHTLSISMDSNSTAFGFGTTSTNGDDLMELPDEFTTLSSRSRNCVAAYCVIFIIAAFANLTVFLSVCHQLDKLKWRITILILHLAIADLIVTFFVIPMEIFWRLTIQWRGGDALCKICQFGRAFGLYLSSNILICISMDRFFAIIFPLRMAGAAKRVKTMIIIAWIMAGLSSVPQVKKETRKK